MSATLIIVQGTTCEITATDVRLDGLLLNMTGWTVRGVLRRDHVSGLIVAEWHTSPSGQQGQATAGNGTAALKITPALSIPWTWSRGVVHAEATEHVSPFRVARIIDRPVCLSREAVI